MKLNELKEQITNNNVLSTISKSDNAYMVILIGPPASGKSTFTNKIKELRDDVEVCSTDDFFMKNGQYVFDVNKIGINHKKNFQKAVNAMKRHHSVVVIDNTNLSVSDFKNYVQAANSNSYKVLFKIFEVDREELIRRTTQRQRETGKEIGVEVIDRMLDKMKNNISNIRNFISQYDSGLYTQKLNESIDNKKIVYVGIFFDVQQIAELNKGLRLNIRPSKVLANPHVTLLFNKDKKSFEELSQMYQFGKEVDVNVVNFQIEDSGHSAFLCKTNEPTKNLPHITASLGVKNGQPTKPVYSTEMLKSGKTEVVPVNKTIKGKIGYFDGEEVKYE
jgi:NEDD4-binding protein 2